MNSGGWKSQGLFRNKNIKRWQLFLLNLNKNNFFKKNRYAASKLYAGK